MRIVVVLLALTLAAAAEAGFGIRPPIVPAALAMRADCTVIGRVAEVEKDAVEADLHPPRLRAQKASYRVAVVKVEKALIGAAGVAQVRVGFTNRPLAQPLGGPPPAAVNPAAGLAGVFFLARHPKTDFYVLADELGPILGTDPMYDKVVAEVEVVGRAIDDPVAVLKSKDRTERFVAAQTVLFRSVRQGAGARDPKGEDLPDELNRRVLGVLAEMPWKSEPGSGYLLAPRATRYLLWHYVPARAYGFQAPTRGGDRDRAWDEATAAFLKDNVDRIKLQRFDRKK